MKKKLGTPYERILVYGQPGTGKTYGIVKIVEQLLKLGYFDSSKFYYIDTDDGVEAVLQEFPKELRDKIEYYCTPTWDEVMDAWEDIQKTRKDGEWIVLEEGGQLWGKSQEYYIKEVFHQDIGRYFLEARRALVAADNADQQAKLDGWKDWSIIKAMHNLDFMDSVTRQSCNIILSAAANEVSSQGIAQMSPGDKKIFSIYARTGYKPEGEKHNAHRFHTVLFLSRDENGRRYETTVKNRGRREWARAPVPDGKGFYGIFLKKVGGSFPAIQQQKIGESEDGAVDDELAFMEGK